MNSEEKEWIDRVDQTIRDIELNFKRANEEIPTQDKLDSYKEMYWTAVLLMEKTGKITSQRGVEEVEASFRIKTIEEFVKRAERLFTN